MIRPLSLALLASSLGACAAAPTPTSDTEALVDRVLRGNPAQLNCAATMYCETNGSRIASAQFRTCTCDPPAAMYGTPVGR